MPPCGLAPLCAAGLALMLAPEMCLPTAAAGEGKAAAGGDLEAADKGAGRDGSEAGERCGTPTPPLPPLRRPPMRASPSSAPGVGATRLRAAAITSWATGRMCRSMCRPAPAAAAAMRAAPGLAAPESPAPGRSSDPAAAGSAGTNVLASRPASDWSARASAPAEAEVDICVPRDLPPAVDSESSLCCPARSMTWTPKVPLLACLGRRPACFDQGTAPMAAPDSDWRAPRRVKMPQVA